MLNGKSMLLSSNRPHMDGHGLWFFSWCFKFTLCKHVRLSYVFLINLLTYLLIRQFGVSRMDIHATTQYIYSIMSHW